MESQTRAIRALRIASLALLAHPLAASADFFVHSWQNHHESPRTLSAKGAFSYYQTAENYDAAGLLLLPSGLESYRRFGGDLTLRYGLLERLSVFGNLHWASVQLNHETRGGVAYGFGDQSAGLNYRLMEKALIIDLQVQGDFPAYDNATANTALTPFLGDGSVDITSGAFASLPLSWDGDRRITIGGGAGYTYRSAGFSAAIPWSLGIEYSPVRTGWIVGLASSGTYSLQTDTATTLPASTRNSIGTGGSFMSNAINPSLVTAKGKLGYQFANNLSISALFARSLVGVSAPAGTLAVLALEKRIGFDPPQKHPVRLAPAEYGRANQGVVDYSIEAKVLRTNDRLQLVKINKGSQETVEVGQVFDIFIPNPDGSAKEAVARARVTSVKPDEAALTVTEYFKEVWIDEGFLAKRVIQ